MQPKAKRRWMGAALAFGACLVWGVPAASAAVVTLTFTGTVATGVDAAGLFGLKGGNLAGLGYVAAYRYDTNRGAGTFTPTDNQLLGGSFYGLQTPSLGATFSIGGRSIAIAGLYFASFSGSTGPSASELSANVTDGDSQTYTQLFNDVYSDSPAVPPYLDRSFTYDVGSSDQPLGLFRVRRNGAFDVSAELLPSRIVESVPEPSTWAMMIVGALGLGWSAVRVRRRNAAAASAA